MKQKFDIFRFGIRVIAKCLGFSLVVPAVLALLPRLTVAQSVPQSTGDLWDISQGAVITGSSGANVPYSDLRDMFGGTFSPTEPGNTVFDNNKPGGFVHYIEWQTPTPVTVGAFSLFAAGDGPTFFYEREFSKFVLKAKSSTNATNFDLTLYELDVTNHPYTWLDAASMALISTNITPVTVQNFRAEFTQYTAGRGYDSPRVLELDGYPTASPSIVSQPAPQTVTAGSDAAFTVGILGPGPLYYQWQLNNDNLPGATNATLTLTSVQTGQSGGLYSVLVTSSFGSTNSTAASLTVNPSGPTYPYASNDLWDISQGSVVTGTSGAQAVSDPRDMFGGQFGVVETGDTTFADNQPPGFVHYVEWQTPGLVTIDSFVLHASGDGPQYLNEREFSKFVLKAKSSAAATNYDVTLYELDVTNHPYTFVDPDHQVLLAPSITPVTAQYFRAEFTQFNAGRGWDGPRIEELDGFGTISPATNAPIIVTQPLPQTVTVGASATFSVGVTGTGPFGYQWQLNDDTLPGSTNATLTLPGVQTDQSGGLYSVIVSGPAGSTNSTAALLTVNPPGPTYPYASNDLWDISQGSVVTGTSGAQWVSDPRDMFGGQFGVVETGDTTFLDNQPPGFVHYIEWQTLGPVMIDSFVLHASGDGPQYLNEREFSKFVLKAKSSAAATNYDVTLYELDVTNHPYTFVDPDHQVLLAPSIAPVTAQYFRAEFTQFNAGRGWDGPRIEELDGFGSNAPVIVSAPADQTVAAGANVTFNVSVTGTGPLGYQWQLNNANLPLATNAMLSLTNVQTNQSGGLYSVIVSNVLGSTNSAAAVLTVNPAGPAYPYSTNDLWDISQGSMVTGTSVVQWVSDPRDMFGGQFSMVEPGNTTFTDNRPAGFVHYVEWQTFGPVTVNSFVLHASGDGPQYLNEREFSKFVLKAKSSAAATNFDLTLYELDVANHPYTFVDPAHQVVAAPNITPVTAQYFRAEFTQFNAGRGWDAPRILELDGYGTRNYTNLPPFPLPPLPPSTNWPTPPLPPGAGSTIYTFTNGVPAALSIAAGGGNVIVSWPASVSGYILEGSGGNYAAGWTPINAALVTNWPTVSVTLPAATAPQFFRLIHP